MLYVIIWITMCLQNLRLSLNRNLEYLLGAVLCGSFQAKNFMLFHLTLKWVLESITGLAAGTAKSSHLWWQTGGREHCGSCVSLWDLRNTSLTTTPRHDIVIQTTTEVVHLLSKHRALGPTYTANMIHSRTAVSWFNIWHLLLLSIILILKIRKPKITGRILYLATFIVAVTKYPMEGFTLAYSSKEYLP